VTSSSNKCLNSSNIFVIIESDKLVEKLADSDENELPDTDESGDDDDVLLAVSGDDESFCVINTNFH
jgi:hypothetical protein